MSPPTATEEEALTSPADAVDVALDVVATPTQKAVDDALAVDATPTPKVGVAHATPTDNDDVALDANPTFVAGGFEKSFFNDIDTMPLDLGFLPCDGSPHLNATTPSSWTTKPKRNFYSSRYFTPPTLPNGKVVPDEFVEAALYGGNRRTFAELEPQKLSLQKILNEPIHPSDDEIVSMVHHIFIVLLPGDTGMVAFDRPRNGCGAGGII